MCPKPSVRLPAKPNKKVIAQITYRVRSLALVPETTNITRVMPGQTPSPNAVELGTSCALCPSARFFLNPPSMAVDSAKFKLNSPFWIVRRTADPSEANMQWDVVQFKCTGKAMHWQSADANYDLDVPILTNKIPIKPGDELIVLSKDIDEQVPSTVPKAKKAKAKDIEEQEGSAEPKAKAKGNAKSKVGDKSSAAEASCKRKREN